MSLISSALASDQEFLDVLSDDVWLISSLPMAKDHSFIIDKELFEVPLHVATIKVRVVSQEFVERILSLVRDGCLCHHWEFNIVLFNEVDDPFRWVRFLRAELVARVS